MNAPTFHSHHDAQALYASGNVTESMDFDSDRTSEDLHFDPS